MREVHTIAALDEDLIVSVLRHLDDVECRATMSCVCKTWRACVKKSWNRVHFCFGDLITLEARLRWLECQLADSPRVLQALELQSSTPSPFCA